MNIENSLIESMKSDRISGLSADTLDLGMKAILENGVLEQVPIFGLMVKTYSATTHIRDSLFSKKIYDFLLNMNSLDSDRRAKAIEKISIKKESVVKAGEAIIALIDKTDDVKKPELISKLFVALGNNKIDGDQFFRASNIINNVYIDDLLKLKEMYNSREFDKKTKSTYASVGIMQMTIAKPEQFGQEYSMKEIGEAVFNSGFEIEYDFTDEAELIAEFCFDTIAPLTRSIFDLIEAT